MKKAILTILLLTLAACGGLETAGGNPDAEAIDTQPAIPDGVPTRCGLGQILALDGDCPTIPQWRCQQVDPLQNQAAVPCAINEWHRIFVSTCDQCPR